MVVGAATGFFLGLLFFGWVDWAGQGLGADDHAPAVPLRRFSILRSALGAVVAILLGVAFVLVLRRARRPRS
jgi:hypothetical protein